LNVLPIFVPSAFDALPSGAAPHATSDKAVTPASATSPKDFNFIFIFSLRLSPFS
jgi:hypothetical protein